MTPNTDVQNYSEYKFEKVTQCIVSEPLLCMRLGLHTKRYKLGPLKKLFSEKSGAFVTGFCNLPAERLRMYMDQRRAKGGFYSERADAFVISPNRRT